MSCDRKQLVEIALHVLVADTEGLTPSAAEVAALRAAFPDLSGLPVDELACAVVQRFSLNWRELNRRAGAWMNEVA